MSTVKITILVVKMIINMIVMNGVWGHISNVDWGRRGFERRHNKVVSRHLPHLIVCKVVTIINMLLIIITAITTIITIILVIMRASKSIISVDLISVNKQVFSFKFGQNFSFHTV